MKLFKNRDLQSKKDKKSDETTTSKTEAGNVELKVSNVRWSKIIWKST